jgi:hypothetical protein
MAACEVAVYYFPGYHVDPRNELWHGRGWTEWDMVRLARPRFEGHLQPKTPAWGHFDEADPAFAAREIDLAADNGVTCFLYDWYWYEGRPFIEGALERGFLQAPNRRRLKFALMWANHDWVQIHPARHGQKWDLLLPGRASMDQFEPVMDYIIEHYFTQPNYLTIAGRPYFSIYEMGTFIRGMGSIDTAAQALARFDAKAKAAGLPGIHFNAVLWGISVLPAEVKVDNWADLIGRLGIASLTSYCWVHHYDLGKAAFPLGSYADALAGNRAVWEKMARTMPAPYAPNVSMGWDSSPRTLQSDKFEQGGYPFTPILYATPEQFREALTAARRHVEQHNVAPPMITINAWNEWTEGSYLLPDTVHGTRFVEAIREVFPQG